MTNDTLPKFQLKCGGYESVSPDGQHLYRICWNSIDYDVLYFSSSDRIYGKRIGRVVEVHQAPAVARKHFETVK